MVLKLYEYYTSHFSPFYSKRDLSCFDYQGPVVQSIVSLISSFRGQLVKCFTTIQPNTLIFFVEKNERSFCNAKASHIFSTKNIGIYEILTFEILTKR